MTEEMRQMIEFVAKGLLRGRGGAIDEHTPLVSSGLIDDQPWIDSCARPHGTVGSAGIPAGA